MDRVCTTKHSVDRTKDRVGLSKKLSEKNAQKAYELGIRHRDTRAGLRRYLDKLYLANGNANNMRVYHRFIYLFRGAKLITILPLPHKFNYLADKLQREKGGNNQ